MNHFPTIIAIGSPYGDDRLGWEAAQSLTDSLPNKVPVLALDRPGITLLSYLSKTSSAIIIDAVQSGASPGTIHWLTGEDIPSAIQPTSSHDIGVKETFQLGKALDILPKQMHFCGIESDPKWQNPNTLSPTTLKSLPILIEQILSLVLKDKIF